jgi:hypothetical protein
MSMDRMASEELDPLDLPTPPRRGSWLTLFLAVIIFVSGLIIGGGGLLALLVHVSRHREEAPAVVAARMKRQLGLTDEQTAGVQEILRTRQEALHRIRDEVQPRFRGEIDLLEKQVDSVLNDRQKAKWHAGLAALRRTWFSATQAKDLPQIPASSPP